MGDHAESEVEKQLGERTAPEPEAGPGPGRPSLERVQAEQDAKDAQAAAENLTAMTGRLVDWPFNYLARRRGDHWALKADERRALSDALSPVLAKYGAGWLETYGLELTLAVTVVLVVGPRLERDKMNVQAKAQGKPVEAQAVAVEPVTAAAAPAGPDQRDLKIAALQAEIEARKAKAARMRARAKK